MAMTVIGKEELQYHVFRGILWCNTGSSRKFAITDAEIVRDLKLHRGCS